MADVVDLRLSGVDKKTVDGERSVRLCNYSDVYNHNVIRADMDYMEATATEREIQNCRLRVGDVIITKDSETPDDIGVPAVVGDEVPNLVCGYHLAILRPLKANLDGRFLHYALSEKSAKRQFQMYANGITRFGLRAADINRVRIPLPSIPEQRKIAAILSSIDDAIEKTQAVIDQAQIVKRGLMQVMLTRGLPGRHTRFKQIEAGDIPDGWDRKTIAEIGEVVTGSTPSTSNHTFWNGEIPFVTPTDLGKAKRVSTTGRHVSEDGLAQVREIPPGSVMVTCIGTIGKVGIAVERCCTNQQINSVITGDAVLSEYLYYALSFASGTLVGLAGMTAVPIVSKSKFLTCGVLVPPLAEQEQIVHVLSSVDHVIEVNQERVAKLTEAKRGLMPLLLDGELRVTPNTEAA